MEESDLRETIGEALVDYLEDEEFDMGSFEEHGVLTRNEGLVLKFHNGEEFQVTIVKSRDANVLEGER